MKEFEAAKQSLAGGSKPKKLRVREVHVRKGHKGGYIAKHMMEDQEGNAHHHTPEYPIISLADLQKHIQEHLGEEGQEAAAQKAGQPTE